MKIPKKYLYKSGRHKDMLNVVKLKTKGSMKFKYGDSHPVVEGVVFSGYAVDGEERWETLENRQNRLSRRRKRKKETYNSERERNARIKYFSVSKNRERKREREARLRSSKEYKAYRRKYCKDYYNKSIQNKLTMNNRSRIGLELRRVNQCKKNTSFSYLGCSIQKLRDHLEAQFTDGMSWENYGRGGWHVDHIIPCTFFDLTKPIHQKVCFNYQNLQPLWEKDNIIKGNKIHWSIVLTLIMNNYKTIGLN